MALEDLMGKDFGIDPKSGYDRGQFVKQMGELTDAKNYYKTLKDSNGSDTGALLDLAGLAAPYMVGNKQRCFEELKNNSQKALTEGNRLINEGEEKTARFAEKHRAKLLEKLTGEQLYALFASMPLYETGEKEHDRIKNLRDRVVKLQKTAEEKGDLGSVVKAELDMLLKNAPKAQQEFLSIHSDAIRGITEDIIEDTYKEFSSLFRNAEGKLDKSALIKYLTDNYEAANTEMKDLPEGKRNDFWGDNLKAQYLALAEHAYKVEKKAQKKSKDSAWEATKEKLAKKGYNI